VSVLDAGQKSYKKILSNGSFKITDFADALYDDLDQVDWPESTKIAQRNWIGRSEGLIFTSPVKDTDITIETYSTHFEAFYADTFVVIAPDHPRLPELVKGLPNAAETLAAAKKMAETRSIQEYENEKNVEGIFTGRYTVDPVGNGELPIWIANYALAEYGTGIVKCSAHDERDFAFAKKYNIPLKEVLEPFFTQSTEPGKVREGEPYDHREAIIAIVKHWSEDKYIALKWKKVAWTTFITGGIEEGQSPEEAARMEIKQETGYLSPKLVKDFGVVHGLFYHVPKKVNRFAHAHALYFELEDDAREEMSDEEKGIHEVLWLTREELEKELTPGTHQYALKKLIGPDFPWTDMKHGILNEPKEFAGKIAGDVRKEIADFAVAKSRTRRPSIVFAIG
jgi:8-oxo-dGTP pyrophosphatase MutT (NUDIX family)